MPRRKQGYGQRMRPCLASIEEREINAAYDASGTLASHNFPVSLAISVVAGAVPRTPWLDHGYC